MMPNVLFVIEFKVDGTSAIEKTSVPLEGIKEKKYHEKYLYSKLPIYLVGIEFDTKDRNISKIESLKVC